MGIEGAGEVVLPDDVEQQEAAGDLQEDVIFGTQHAACVERGVGLAEVAEARQERRDLLRPLQVGLSEFLPQESLLGEHDPFVVDPVQQPEEDDEPGILGEKHQSQPHEEIAQVEGMSYHGVPAAGVEGVGHLLLAVAARGALVGMGDGLYADEKAQQAHRQIAQAAVKEEGVFFGGMKKEEEQLRHQEDHRDLPPVAEELLSRLFPFFDQCHVSVC